MQENSPSTKRSAPGGMPDPSGIFQLATGYWPSAVLLTANKLGVFGALANGEQTAAQVAHTIASEPRAVEMLLNACGGLGLLTKNGDRYALTPTAAAFLVPGRPGYLGSALHWSLEQFTAWGRLDDATRTGRPAVTPELHLGDDPQQTREFVLAMHERAKGVARGVVEFLDLTSCQTALDVGGGPGTYATLLAQKHPLLHIAILDLPGIVAVAQELIAANGMAERVQTLAGDATTATYGEATYDAVLFCGVLHQFSPATIRRMLAGAQRALKDGGRLLVCDMMLDATKTQPLFSALFSLQMLLTSREGAVFAAPECATWLADAGFADIQVQSLPPPLPYTVIHGRKPGRNR